MSRGATIVTIRTLALTAVLAALGAAPGSVTPPTPGVPGTPRIPPPRSDLSVRARASGDGATLVYTAVVVNHGPAPATHVVLRDRLPARTSLRSASRRCSLARVVVTCRLGTLRPLAAARVVLTLSRRGDGRVTNSLRVRAAQPDPVAANDVAVIRGG